MTSDRERPYWSVMIPTYNCDERFEGALCSVLEQDPGPERMQIAVVDDASRTRHHEEVIRRLAPERVELYGQVKNVGLSANWNACLARSRGRWVHILHQDDAVLPGFYDALALAGGDPAVGAAFCRQRLTYHDGPECLSACLRPTAGVLPQWLETISKHQHIQCASIVVRREVYETIGGYRGDLCFALDWEMWVRIAANYAVWFEPRPLACYRHHPKSETSRLSNNNARHIADVRKAAKIIRGNLPRRYRKDVGSEVLRFFRDQELTVTCEAFRDHDLATGIAGLRRAIRSDPAFLLSRDGLNYCKWAMKVWLLNRLARDSPPRPV